MEKYKQIFGCLRGVNIAFLNRMISKNVIVYVIFEQKLEETGERAIYVERRGRRRPSKLIYLKNGEETNLCGQ